jgi:hypothetical protein
MTITVAARRHGFLGKQSQFMTILHHPVAREKPVTTPTPL